MSVIVCRIYVGITGKNFSCLSYILLSEYLFEISQMLKKSVFEKTAKNQSVAYSNEKHGWKPLIRYTTKHNYIVGSYNE